MATTNNRLDRLERSLSKGNERPGEVDLSGLASKLERLQAGDTTPIDGDDPEYQRSMIALVGVIGGLAG